MPLALCLMNGSTRPLITCEAVAVYLYKQQECVHPTGLCKAQWLNQILSIATSSRLCHLRHRLAGSSSICC